MRYPTFDQAVRFLCIASGAVTTSPIVTWPDWRALFTDSEGEKTPFYYELEKLIAISGLLIHCIEVSHIESKIVLGYIFFVEKNAAQGLAENWFLAARTPEAVRQFLNKGRTRRRSAVRVTEPQIHVAAAPEHEATADEREALTTREKLQLIARRNATLITAEELNAVMQGTNDLRVAANTVQHIVIESLTG